jgi:hypothetical protein
MPWSGPRAVTTADGHGGTLVTEVQPQQRTLLTHPQD